MNNDKTQLAWQATLICYFTLLLMLTIDHAWLRPHFFLPVLLIQTLPLLLVLPGLIKKHTRSGIWLCFMILFHFLAAVSNAFTASNKIFYASETVLILVLFTSSLLFVRWTTRS